MRKQEQPSSKAAAMMGQPSSTVAVVGTDGAMVGASSCTPLYPHQDRPRAWWGARHTMAFLGFLGFSTVYAMRVNLSVAIVAMVKSEPSTGTNDSVTDTCPLPDDWKDPANSDGKDGEFDWDETTQGLVLGSFFYGYLFTNLPGGRAAEYFGGKRVLGLGILLTAIFTVVSPLCARLSTGLFVAVRIIEGLTEGVTFPAMNILLATWIPPLERAKFSSLVYAGAQFGTVVTLPVSGWLCDSDFLGGWPAVFYVFGGLGILWSVAWFFLVFDNPDTHPRISQEEKLYILHNCAERKSQNGFVSALPYLTMWISSLLYSNAVDSLLAAGKLSLTTVRKISMVIGIYGPMVGLIAMCFVDCDRTLAIVVLCIAVGLNGAIYSGYMCSHQDLSPNLAGTLMGITNTVATIPGFVTPVVTGAITRPQTLSAWRTVFLISAGIYLVTNIGYLLFVPTTVQPWNDQSSSPSKGEQQKY